MPFKSEAQRRFLYAKHPEIAKRWAAEYGNKVQDGKGGGPGKEQPPSEKNKILGGGQNQTNELYGQAAARRLARSIKKK